MEKFYAPVAIFVGDRDLADQRGVWQSFRGRFAVTAK
jgi:hypothetical protein